MRLALTVLGISHRVENPRQTVWGIRGERKSRQELIFDRESAPRLRTMLDGFLNS